MTPRYYVILHAQGANATGLPTERNIAENLMDTPDHKLDSGLAGSLADSTTGSPVNSSANSPAGSSVASGADGSVGSFADSSAARAVEVSGQCGLPEDLAKCLTGGQADSAGIVRAGFEAGQTVAQAVYLSGAMLAPALCSGLGLCGACAVQFMTQAPAPTASDQEFFTSVMLDEGWRLGCRHRAEEGIIVGLPASAQMLAQPGRDTPELTFSTCCCDSINRLAGETAESGEQDTVSEDTVSQNTATNDAPKKRMVKVGVTKEEAAKKDVARQKALFLTVDLGTTSVHWSAFRPVVPDRQEELRFKLPGAEPLPGYPVDEQVQTVKGSGCSGCDRTDGVDFSGLEFMGGGSFANPQMGAGSDVVSRIQFSLSDKGRQTLCRLTLNMLNWLTEQVHGAEALFLAANPAMASIAFGNNVRSLSQAPYVLPDAGGDWVYPVCDDSVRLPPIWVAPHISPFVGGDISAGYAYLTSRGAQFPFLLADMGTNGEFLLALSPDCAYATSVALGPALEGINLTYGSVAGPGVITGFSVTPLGLEPHCYNDEEGAPYSGNPQSGAEDPSDRQIVRAGLSSVLAEETGLARVESRLLTANSFSNGKSFGQKGKESASSPFGQQKRISGTGYISLLACLLRSRALSRTGQFTPGGGLLAKSAQAVRQGNLIEQNGQQGQNGKAGNRPGRCATEPCFPLPHNLYLFGGDVEELLKVKAAFSLGLSRILAHAGLPFHALNGIYLAGALGEFVDTGALEELGFFPSGTADRITPVGNAALKGLCCLAQDRALRGSLVRWVKQVESVNLADDTVFHEDFYRHMIFAYPETSR